jgi:hypothetical protein
MGRFTYETTTKADFEDRLLAHLQIVIGMKLRRGECFFFTWKEDASVGNGRTAVWMHPGATLTFKFHGSRTPQINRAWADALARAANSPGGLYVVREPDPDPENADDGILVG